MDLNQYDRAVFLREPFSPSVVNRPIPELVSELLGMLEADDTSPSIRYTSLRELLRGRLNQVEPGALSADFINKMDSLLQLELKQKTIVAPTKILTLSQTNEDADLENAHLLSIWRGDITHLAVDAIVNAANRYMLGCFQPLHACIDNAIHSAAGPRLREDCATIMRIQGHLERTGTVKITRAYNLPSNFVLHTVGPIIPRGSEVHPSQARELASCYTSCLDLAHEVGNIRSVAFCAISTGVFGFPKREAASIALHSVDRWLSTHNHSFDRIIFNVFSLEDEKVYQDALHQKKGE